MKPINRKNQGGVALIMFVLMLMGVGGILFVGYSQGLLKQVELSKSEHNTRVLNEAKQALLQYAYNYPQFNSEGPGRLPCPDNDNDGLTGALTIALCESVGRLPWAEVEMNFYDARDSDEERLWYAVSDQFYNLGGGPIINSDSVGSITLVDQSQNIIYYGDVAGIAAIIIAPGTALAGQDRVADENDPANYLDSVNGFDNSVFINGESDDDADGFILGPVFDQAQNFNVVNDQMIVITAAEVIEVAEKATLQAYQTAINDYRDNIKIDTPAFDAYPWLDDYNTTDLTVYDGDVGTRLGRLPSIFGNYFSGSSSGTIISEIELSILYDEFTWDETLVIANVNFDASGDLVTDSTYTNTKAFYIWDGHATTPDANSPRDGVWEQCIGTAGTGPFGTGFLEDDCNRKTDGTYKDPTDSNPDRSDVWLEVKLIDVTFNVASANIILPNADLKGAPISYAAPTAIKHAFVSGDYNNNSGYFTIDEWKFDADFLNSFDDDLNPIPNFGDNPADRIRVGIRYYPELPNWTLATQDNWHNSIQMAYSSGYQPGAASSCTAGTDCITVNNVGGIQNDKIAVLVLASDLNLLDDDDNAVPIPAAPGYLDELDDIFDTENDDGDDIFDARANNGTGNDKILVIR